MKFHTTWHAVHLLMTILTLGWWIPIWVWRSLSNSQANRCEEYAATLKSLRG